MRTTRGTTRLSAAAVGLAFGAALVLTGAQPAAAIPANPTCGGLSPAQASALGYTTIIMVAGDVVAEAGNPDPLWVHGSSQWDSITTGSGDDLICANGGGDVVASNRGDDTVHGGDGNDVLRGFGGDDVLFGEDDADSTDGGAGIDFCFTSEITANCP